jgi:hypothetical protein
MRSYYYYTAHRNVQSVTPYNKTDNDGRFILPIQLAIYNPIRNLMKNQNRHDGQRNVTTAAAAAVTESYTFNSSSSSSSSSGDYVTTDSYRILHALQRLLCRAVQDLLWINDRNQNICPLLLLEDDDNNNNNNIDSNTNNNNDDATDSVTLGDTTSTASTTPSIVNAYPYTIQIVEQQLRLSPPSSDNTKNKNNNNNMEDTIGYQWTVWTIQYTIVQIGDVYIEEAIQNHPSQPDYNTTDTTNTDLNIQDVSQAAVQSMIAVLQLTVDVNCMDGTLDTILQSTRRSTSSRSDQHLENDPFLYCSPVVAVVVHNDTTTNPTTTTTDEYYNDNFMIRKWSTIYETYQQRYTYTPRLWYPMRIAGLCLLATTLFLLLGLCTLSRRRRRQRHPATRTM